MLKSGKLSQAKCTGFSRAGNLGFSLVELIVVIAILAILVGVAVPVYSQYINRAQTAADEQYLESVARAAQAYAAERGLSLASVHVAPVVTDSQGVELVLADGTVCRDGLSDLYAIVGSYTFLTSDSTQTVEYYDPSRVPDSPDPPSGDVGAHEHVYQTISEPTCVNPGYEKCEICGDVRQLPASGHQFVLDKTVGNLKLYTCTECGYQKIEFEGVAIG